VALQVALVGVGILLVAALYSSVGHGGGSGYLAVMTLLAIAPAEMRPSALLLNIGVTTIGAWTYLRRGQFSMQVLWPFAVTAIPMAFLGGQLDVSGMVYKPLLAAALVYSAWYLFSPQSTPNDDPSLRPPVLLALVLGAGIGLLAGLTGIGGGIFLSPLLLFNRWSATRVASGVVSVFILLNSSAGLAGQLATVADVPWNAMTVWLPAALAGGFVGSRYGSRIASSKVIYRLLGLVLVIAAAKLVFTLGD
jgi:uncharacterized membrane protein YfcA